MNVFREDNTKEDMLTSLKELRQAGQKQLSDSDCHHMIDFAARLIAPINIGTLPNEIIKRRHLEWKTGTLRSLIAGHFNEPPVLTFERLRLPKAFDAWNLSKIGGIKMRFTDNLTDHLLLVDDDAVVLVFHHVSYLKQQDKECVLQFGVIHITKQESVALTDNKIYASSGTGRGDNQDDCLALSPSRIQRAQAGQAQETYVAGQAP